MKKFTIYLSGVLFTIISLAQPGWNWPEDEEMKSMALEAQANSHDILLPTKKYNEALQKLNWLYTNTPDLHKSIYQDGAKCVKAMLKTEKDAARVERLQDSLLWMFDQRIKYFDNDAKVMDRKVYEANLLYYKNPKKYPLLDKLYTEAYDANGNGISNYNLNSYMFFAKNYHKADPAAMPAERVLEIHDRVSEVIAYKLANGGDSKRLTDEQNKTDAWLSSIEGILSCDFIEEKLVPKFKANPSDLSIAKKIFKYSVQAKCTSEPYFLEASEPVFAESPSFSLADAIGSRYLAGGEHEKALEYFEKATELATEDQDKHDALMGQASALNKLGRKATSRAKAYEALKVIPGSADAYNLIGNLYFTSFNTCKEEKSKVKDRGVFLAAYEMYQKAGNSSQMAAAKAQFPSIEEIFSESYEEGQTLAVGCWINTSVKIQRR